VPDVELLAPFVPKTGTGTGRSNDTGYFYVKRDIEVNGIMTTRKVCRACLYVLRASFYVYVVLTTNHRENREKDPTAQVHHHALSTSTSTLRNHLNKAHRAKYDAICAQNSWKNHLKDTEKQKAEAANVVARVAAREPFNVKGLLNRIARFIVADDQVFFFKSFIIFLLIIITVYQSCGMPRIPGPPPLCMPRYRRFRHRET
jgi:hypothetical protein